MQIKQKIQHLLHRPQKSIFSASLVLAVTFALSAGLGYLRSRFLYARFLSSAAPQLDAYNAAFRLPDLIFKLLVSGALSASFIPVFSSLLAKNPQKANQTASTVINLLFLVFVFAALIIYIFAKPFSRLIAAGFSESQIELMAHLSRILLVAQIFFLVSNFFTAILQVNQNFLIPALSPIIYNLFIILSIFTLAPEFGIHGVVYGVVVGAFFHLAIQIPAVKRVGFHYLLFINTRLTGIREIIRLMIPRTLSLGLSEIQNTATLFFASTLAVGSLSLYNLALQIIYLPSRIFATTVGQASLPLLSRSIAKNHLGQFRSTVNRTILQILYLALPISALILLQRVTIIRIAFGARQFPWKATLTTAKTLAFLTPVIVCQAATQILIRSFYALHNTKTPFYLSLFSLLINLTANFYFVNFTSLGIIGLAISASLSEFIQSCGLLFLFKRHLNGTNWSSLFQNLAKMLLSTLIMGISTWFLIKFLDLFILNTSRTLSLVLLFVLASIFATTIYLLCSRLFSIDEYQNFRRHFSRLKLSISL